MRRLLMVVLAGMALTACGAGVVGPLDGSPSSKVQQRAGDGWRLLLDDTVGSPYVVRVATDETQLALLWQQLGQQATPPMVNFDSEIVVHFGAVVSGSCPEILFDDVVIDLEKRLVHAEFGSPIRVTGTRACTLDARPHAYVVAIERAALPLSPFTVQLYATIRCPGCDGSEPITVDLDNRDQSRLVVPTLSREESGSPDFAYRGALVGTLAYEEDFGCVWLETEGGPRSILWPPNTELALDPLALTGPNQWVAHQGDELLLSGGRAGEDLQLEACNVGDWTWIATEVTQAPIEPAPPPREYANPDYDLLYTPATFGADGYQIVIDRWPWALLTDSGWITISKDGELVVAAPTAWTNGEGDLLTFLDPYTGEIVVQLDTAERDATISKLVEELSVSRSDSDPN